jgi:uncharacterized membrane protein YhhN
MTRVFKKYLLFNIFFLTIFLVGLLQSSNPFPLLASLDKPVFTGIASLMLIYFTRLRGRFHRRVLFAFICLLAGTLLLELTNDTHMVYVLLCFFIAQIYFIRAFYLDFSSAPELDKAGARVAIVFGVLFSFTTYLYLRPYLGAYKIPALIYGFLITLVMIMAAFRRLRVNQSSFNLILTGSILLAASAVLFAVYWFIAKNAYNKLAVDAAYMLGIYSMVLGAIERKLVLVD